MVDKSGKRSASGNHVSSIDTRYSQTQFAEDAATKRRIIVFHRGYGCDTGCCGHAIEIDGEEHGNGANSADIVHRVGEYTPGCDFDAERKGWE